MTKNRLKVDKRADEIMDALSGPANPWVRYIEEWAVGDVRRRMNFGLEWRHYELPNSRPRD